MYRLASVLSIGVTGGLIALGAGLFVATLLGVAMRRRAGQFRPASPGTPAKTAGALTEADLGAGLGRQATLVQFSTAMCAPWRPTRQILAQVAEMVDGVTHVEIDAAERLDLVRRLSISSTPTILVLDPGGAIVKRASGLPRKVDVIAALGAVVPAPAAQAPDRSQK